MTGCLKLAYHLNPTQKDFGNILVGLECCFQIQYSLFSQKTEAKCVEKLHFQNLADGMTVYTQGKFNL